jgi:hypothetical protein
VTQTARPAAELGDVAVAVLLVVGDHEVRASATTAAMSGFPVRHARDGQVLGCVHQSVAPTSRPGAVTAIASVRDGTRETTRSIRLVRAAPRQVARRSMCGSCHVDAVKTDASRQQGMTRNKCTCCANAGNIGLGQRTRDFAGSLRRSTWPGGLLLVGTPEEELAPRRTP